MGPLCFWAGRNVEFVEEFYLLEKQHDGMEGWLQIITMVVDVMVEDETEIF
jgi:hypothetical protein